MTEDEALKSIMDEINRNRLPSIRPEPKHSQSCHGIGFTVVSEGSVRRCRHGRVQIAKRHWGADGNHIQTVGATYWKDLSPFWNRKRYRLAVWALGDL